MLGHPYRTCSPPPSEATIAERDDGARIAFAVMTFAGAIQVVIGALHGGPPSAQTLFGAACSVAGLAWLLHREP